MRSGCARRDGRSAAAKGIKVSPWRADAAKEESGGEARVRAELVCDGNLTLRRADILQVVRKAAMRKPQYAYGRV